ncbi:MAG: TonB-dependent receptor [Gemmatimonadales bacterium]|nr:TonB-dependent receptor [Gemmatimonadales bacterium]
MTPPRRRCARILLLALLVTGPAPLLAQVRDTLPREPITLEPLVVRVRRLSQFGPLPGLLLREDQIPANIQSATQADLRKSGAVGLNEFLASDLQSIHTNDFRGNPLQSDVLFRGFSASPQIGSPQGLSVFLDGVRVNESFGDVVNWDLLPLNAVSRVDLFPGANPLFGLNTLGGALSLRTRSGFSDKGVEAEGSGGGFGRRQLRLAAGGSRGPWALFGAGTLFDEAGWRDNSPSTMAQGFLRVDRVIGNAMVTGTALVARNDLIGNGVVPTELWRRQPAAVFSSPDETRHRLAAFTLSTLWSPGGPFNLTAQLYRRSSRRSSTTGLVYEDYQHIDPRQGDGANPIPGPITAQTCRYLDADQDGIVDRRTFINPVQGDTFYVPITLNAPCNPLENLDDDDCDAVCALARQPTGLLDRSQIGQLTWGGGVQLTWNPARHAGLFGVALDRNGGTYDLRQRLATVDPTRQVIENPGVLAVGYRAAQLDVPLNTFTGHGTTWSLYASDTWSPRGNLHLTVAARFNTTRLDNRLVVANLRYLHQYRTRNTDPLRILCPTPDLASCPAPSPYRQPLGELPRTVTSDAFTFRSLNPSFGVTWQARPTLGVYASWGMGARTPSVVELGCAFDATPVNVNDGQFVDDSTPAPPLYVARSLAGPACTLPTQLSGDPYLPQIRSRAAEAGLRGLVAGRWEWNMAVYRTTLQDDIGLVAVSPFRNYFQSIGTTRRQGVELGLRGRLGGLGVRVGYGLTDATYQSTHWEVSPRNSSADFDANSQPGSALPSPNATRNGGAGTYNAIRVDPGAHIPGVPLHNLNLGLDYAMARGWTVGLGMVARSRAYMRGNENNRHAPADSVFTTSMWSYDADGYTGGGGVRTLLPPFAERGVLPAYAVFNLSTTIRVGADAIVSARVTNLLDTRYATAGRLGVTPFTSSPTGATVAPSGFNSNFTEWRNTAFVGPGAPRALWLTVTYAMPNGGPGD